MNLEHIARSLGIKWLLEGDSNPRLTYADCKIIPLLGKEFTSGFCLGEYSYDNSDKTTLGKLIHCFKYKSDQKAGEILADLIAELIKEKYSAAEAIETVPPSFTSRIFQPIDYLTELVSSKTGLPWLKDVLSRTRLSKRQKDLRSWSEKKRNVKGLFKVNNGESVRAKKIVVLDDVYDSGATLDEICSVLKQDKAYIIGVVAVARTGFRQYGLP